MLDMEHFEDTTNPTFERPISQINPFVVVWHGLSLDSLEEADACSLGERKRKDIHIASHSAVNDRD